MWFHAYFEQPAKTVVRRVCFFFRAILAQRRHLGRTATDARLGVAKTPNFVAVRESLNEEGHTGWTVLKVPVKAAETRCMRRIVILPMLLHLLCLGFFCGKRKDGNAPWGDRGPGPKRSR